MVIGGIMWSYDEALANGMRLRCGQLSDHALHFPIPVPGWNAEMMAGNEVAILDRESEGTY